MSTREIGGRIHPLGPQTVAFAALVILVAVAVWQTSGPRRSRALLLLRQPRGIMGTQCHLAARAAPGREGAAREALARAESEIRRQEALLSNWMDDSEIARFNRAPAGVETRLSPDCMEVLRAAREARDATGGSFDVTCRAAIELWNRAAAEGTPPTPGAVAAARVASSWELIRLGDRGATKSGGEARVDLGGIAKGYAIDRALALLRGDPSIRAGMVEIGGDLAAFGQPWPVEIRHPTDGATLARITLPDGLAVCTSGDYARPVVIAGARHSHIIDPRTGYPAASTRSVTAIAPRCIDADIWATALSVLGPEGIDRLPPDAEALVVSASDTETGGLRMVATPGFSGLWIEPPATRVEIRPRPGGAPGPRRLP